MNIKAVIFDVDNTLYNYDAAHAAAFEALCDTARQRLGLDAEAFTALYDRAMEIQVQRAGEDAAAIHNRLLRFQIMAEELRQPLTLAPELSECYWSVFLEAMEPFPGLCQCLRALKEKGYRLGIGTNMTADFQYEKLRRLNVLELLDFIVTSEEVNAEKPHEKLFRFCAAKAGCRMEECVFVGDSLSHDARGAAQAGMVPVWLCPDPGRKVEGVRKISSLQELPGLLESGGFF